MRANRSPRRSQKSETAGIRQELKEQTAVALRLMPRRCPTQPVVAAGITTETKTFYERPCPMAYDGTTGTDERTCRYDSEHENKLWNL